MRSGTELSQFQRIFPTYSLKLYHEKVLKDTGTCFTFHINLRRVVAIHEAPVPQ